MADKKKYLTMLDDVSTKNSDIYAPKNFRAGYKGAKKIREGEDGVNKVALLAKGYLRDIESEKGEGDVELTSKERGKYVSVAHELMKIATKEGMVNAAILSGNVYASLDEDGRVPESVVKRMLNAYEKSTERDKSGDNLKSNHDAIEEFINEHDIKVGSLESMAVAIVGVAGLIVAMVFLSGNVTGNVVGGLSRGGGNIVGVLGLVVALGCFMVWNRD